MTTGLKLITTFVLVLLLDGLVLPAFFGFRESFLSLLVLIMPILYMGITRQSIVYGVVFVLIFESIGGLNFGDMAVPFLFVLGGIYLFQRFLDIKQTHNPRFSWGKLFLVVGASVALVHVFFFFYKYGSINMHYFSLAISLTLVLEAVLFFLVLNIIFDKKSDYL